MGVGSGFKTMLKEGACNLLISGYAEADS